MAKMDPMSVVETLFRWHIDGLTISLSKNSRRPIEQINAEVLNTVPKVAEFISDVAEKEGYTSAEVGTYQQRSAFILLVSMALGFGTFKMVDRKIAARSKHTVEDKQEVDNLLRDMGLG